jgi:transcriptional regulator of acetoin/glycerol metabolism
MVVRHFAMSEHARGLLQGESDLSLPLRRDSLPEHTRYADTGCTIHPSCLTCPLVRCRYDEPGGARKILNHDRDASILRVKYDERLTVEAVARRFGVSRRTVFRALARARLSGREGRQGGRPW